MKKLFLLTITSISLLSIQAQDKQADIARLMEVMQVENMINQMMDNMLPMMQQMGQQEFDTQENTEQLDTFMNQLMAETKELSLNLVRNVMPEIYSNHFEQNEIQDLISFYETPSGQKMIEKTPVITQDLMTRMMQDEMPAFQEKIMEMIENLKN